MSSNIRGEMLARCKGVIVDGHCLLRWNERVKSPSFESVSQLKEYLERIFWQEKFDYVWQNFFVLDDDIVAVVDCKEGYVKMVTFYGRRSKNPILYNIKRYMRNRDKYGDICLEMYAL